jgi:predicted phosphoribosyltransferase
MVGAHIALRLKAILGLLLVEMIALPAEIDPIGAISEKGDFTYNNLYSAGQIEDLMMDFRGFVEDQKRINLSHMHSLLGRSAGLRPDLLHDRHILLVSDGLNNGLSLDCL